MLLGKYLAYLACTVLLVLPSVMLVYFLIVPIGGGSIGAAFPSLLADLGMLVVGLASTARCSARRRRLKRPLVVGLVFAFGWEPAVLLFPGLSSSGDRGLLPAGARPACDAPGLGQQSDPATRHRRPASMAASLLSLAIVTVAGLWLAGRAVNQRDYVLDQ